MASHLGYQICININGNLKMFSPYLNCTVFFWFSEEVLLHSFGHFFKNKKDPSIAFLEVTAMLIQAMSL